MCIYNCACDPASAYELWNANNDVCRMVQFLTSMRLRNSIYNYSSLHCKHETHKHENYTIVHLPYSSYNSLKN